MRAFKSVAVSISFTLAMAGIAVAGTRLRVTGDDVSLRPIGDLNSEVLGSVNRGQVLEAVDWPCDGEWVSVKPPKELKFWIFSDLVVDNTVDRSRVKVRGGPSVNYKPVATLSKGDKVNVLGRTGEWFQIDPPESAVVWISSRFVEPADGSAPAKPVAVVAPAPAPEPVHKEVLEPEVVAAPLAPPPPPPPPLDSMDLPPLELPPAQVVQADAEPVSVPVVHDTPPPSSISIAEMKHVPPPTHNEEPVKSHEPHPVGDSPAVASMPSTRPASPPATSLISSPRTTSVQHPASETANVARQQPVQTVQQTSEAHPAPVAQPDQPVATAHRRVRTATPRTYPQSKAPTRTQTEYVPAPGETRVMYSGELTSGGKLTITNRGEYRLVTRDAQGRAITLCFLSGSAEQFESLRGEPVKVEGYQTWNTGARHPTVMVDSIVRASSTGRER